MRHQRDKDGIDRCPTCSRWVDVVVDLCTCRAPVCHSCCIDQHDDGDDE